MKNLKKISRDQLKGIQGGGLIRVCSHQCCPTDGKPLCPGVYCPAVVCPELV